MGLSPTCHGVHACALYQSVGMLVIACFLPRFCRQLETGCRQPETSLPQHGSCVLSHPRTRSGARNFSHSGGLIAFFWFTAGALVGVAASLVAIPLWRSALTLVRRRMRYGL